MYLTNKKVRKFNPCYDPIKYYKDSEKYTLIDVLKNKNIPAKDRLWVIVRTELLTLNQLKYYGLACAKLSLKYTNDKSVKDCVKITEKYLEGKASKSELENARSAAATRSAAARSAAARSAAARSAAAAANWSAIAAATRFAAAARSAIAATDWSAIATNWSAAARSKTEDKQCKALIKIIKEIK